MPLPAVVGVKEGINLPRYPSVPGRLRAKKKEVERIVAGSSPSGALGLGAGEDSAASAARCPARRSCACDCRRRTLRRRDPRARRRGRAGRRRPARAHRVGRTMSGAAPARYAAIGIEFGGAAVSGPVLVFVEHAGGEADRLVARGARAGARRSPRARRDPWQRSCSVDGRGCRGAARGTRGRRSRMVATDTAPGRLCAGRRGARRSRQLVAAPIAGRGRGRRDRARRTRCWPTGRATGPADGRQRASRSSPGDPFRLTRQRWAGSLLEDARLDAPVRLLTVAPHAVAPTPAAAAGPRADRRPVRRRA